MFYRILSSLFGLATVGALLGSGYLYLWPPAEESGLVVLEPERVVSSLVPDHPHVIDFTVQNRTNRTLRVLGAPPYC